MIQAWEVFFSEWERWVGDADPAALPRAGTAYTRRAEAIGHAGAETVRHLRDVGGWSLLNSHLLAARLVEASSDWLLRDGVDTGRLRARLRSVGVDEELIEERESEWRRTTEAVLAGFRARVDRVPAVL